MHSPGDVPDVVDYLDASKGPPGDSEAQPGVGSTGLAARFPALPADWNHLGASVSQQNCLAFIFCFLGPRGYVCLVYTPGGSSDP